MKDGDITTDLLSSNAVTFRDGITKKSQQTVGRTYVNILVLTLPVGERPVKGDKLLVQGAVAVVNERQGDYRVVIDATGGATPNTVILNGNFGHARGGDTVNFSRTVDVIAELPYVIRHVYIQARRTGDNSLTLGVGTFLDVMRIKR